MKIRPTMLAVCVLLVGVIAFAAAPRNTTTLQKDASNEPIQVAPAGQLYDGTASVKTVNNLALTTNVVTITTSTSHGYSVGQRVTVSLLTGPTLFADVNGTFKIATVPSGTTFTYALTHADIVTGAATGTTTANYLSPIPTGTTEQALVFPGGSFALIVIPTDAADATFSYTSGGGIGGTFPLYQNTSNVICGTEGDVVYIQRTSTTKLAFQFAKGK